MPPRMERPDQAKEEWKEEPESVRAGDTQTGPRSASRRVLFATAVIPSSMEGAPLPTAGGNYLHKAGQRRSQMGRIECLNQDREELKEEPELESGNILIRPWLAMRNDLVTWRPDFLRLMRGKLAPASDDADNDMADQRGSGTRKTEPSACGDGPCYPKTVAECPRANWKDDYDLRDHRRTKESELKRKSALKYLCSIIRPGSAAAVWIMMALTVATFSLAGAECIGTEVELDKGEAVLRCRLPVSVGDTGQAIIVKHFPDTGSDPDTVMYCFGPAKKAVKPKCESNNGFSLVGQLTDQVVAKVPVSRLMVSGAYKCQLLPLGDHPYFIPCHIHRFSDNEPAGEVPVTKEDQGTAARPTPVVSSAAKDHKPGKDPPNREAPPCVEPSSSVGLTAAVLVQQIIIIVLLLVNFFCLQNRNKLYRPQVQRAALMCPQ